ncbi:MAG: Ger(x)C family spore germination protein [Eubacteriaceae bacterium]
MKKMIIILLVAILLLASGCFSYRDMNRLFFGTVGLFDINDKGELLLYGESFTTNRGGEEFGTEVRIILTGTGKTVLGAFYGYGAKFPIAYDMNKVLIYTERLARQGFKDYMDSPRRNQKPSLKQYLFVCEGDVEKLLSIEISDEKFLGMYLENMMIFQSNVANVRALQLNDFLNEQEIGSKISLMPIIGVVEKVIEERIDVIGVAIIEDYKMIDKLSVEELVYYKFLNNEMKIGYIDAVNPQNENGYVSLNTGKTKTKRTVTYKNNIVQVDIMINTIVSLEEAEGGIDLLDDKIRKQIEKNASEVVKNKCMELFDKYKEKGIDLLNIQADMQRKYPKVQLEDIMEVTKLNLEVKVQIEGSGNITDSK